MSCSSAEQDSSESVVGKGKDILSSPGSKREERSLYFRDAAWGVKTNSHCCGELGGKDDPSIPVSISG